MAQDGQTALAVFWGNYKPETMHCIKDLLGSSRFHQITAGTKETECKGANPSDSHSSGHLRKTFLKSRQHVGT